MAQISVIIPVYNGMRYINNCIENLSAQDLTEIEIVFVDDGSTDGSLELLRSLESERVRVLTQRNAGAGVARNTGLACATGEYVAFLDVDDTFANHNTLRRLYETAVCHNALICGGSFGTAESVLYKDEKRVFTKEGFINFESYQFIHGFTRFIYNRRFLIENGITFPPYRIYEDPVFLMNAMISAKKFYAIVDAVYIYSGPHQTDLNTEKTVDYLHGLRDCLQVSAEHGLAVLHKDIYEQLKSSGSYYVEKNLMNADVYLFDSLIETSAAIDRKLLESVGVVLNHGCAIPALHTIWHAGQKYMKLRNYFLSLKFWERSRK